MAGGYPPGCTQWHVDQANSMDDVPPRDEAPEPRYICADCEYFDRHNGDCLNSLSPRFQTTAEQTCAKFYPDTTLWPPREALERI